MALDKITTAIIADDAVTAAKIVAGAVGTSEIADGTVVAADIGADAVGTTELANDVTISTSGNITTTGSGTLTVAGASTLTGNATASGNLTVTGDIVPSTPLSNRNLIINGGMQVWQRGTTAVTSANAYHTADRWKFEENTDGAYTNEYFSNVLYQAPGHGTALKLVCSTADAGTTAAGHYAYFRQKIEAQNLQGLQYGFATAKTITLSFWVKSNLTGTYCISLLKADSTAYFYVREYTISSANTWEQKTITITPTAGSTSLITSAAAAIANDNGVGFELGFCLSFGSTYHGTNDTWTSSSHYATSNQVNWLGTVDNNFYITGVQLELGSNATPFEHRSYGEELARCQRYYEKQQGFMSVGHCISTSEAYFPIDYKVQKRTSSVAITVSGTLSSMYIRDAAGTSGSATGSLSGEFYDCNANASLHRTGSGLVSGNAAQVRSDANNAGIQIDAEL